VGQLGRDDVKRGRCGALAAGPDDLLVNEDTDGAAVWRAIVRAIAELQRERRPGEAVN
jgi:hypothetical protein